MEISIVDLIEANEENTQTVLSKPKCDKFDYLISVACGAIGGVIDVFLVGSPKDSILGKWTDSQVDNAVMHFAKALGWTNKGNKNNVKSAIGFLESGGKNFDGFRVNYDQRKPGDVGNKFNIAPNTHHMMSLGHSPDIVGLFFSILNQFTSTSSFIANGQLITVDTETFELYGGNLVAKLFCGVANWFGHLMSDVAGSSGSHSRGTGIVMPFYEFFGFCKFGNFSTGSGKADLAELAQKAFNQGYDFRFGLTQAIPVVITDLSIRLIWALRRRYEYKRPLKECIPSRKYDDLRMMLLIGNGTLCVIDGIDAAAHSGGDALLFFMRLNLVAWFRLVMLVLKEVFIRLKISGDMDAYVESYKIINEALSDYLRKLESIDLESYKKETTAYNTLLNNIDNIKTEKDLNLFLENVYDKLGIDKPWEGDFNEFMSNKENRLVFK